MIHQKKSGKGKAITIEVRERLEKIDDYAQLSNKDFPRIREILKNVSMAEGVADLRKRCRVSSLYFQAAYGWLLDQKLIEIEEVGGKRKGRQRKKLKLTTEGREALIYLQPLESTEVEFTVDRGEKPGMIKLRFACEGLSDIVKLRRLLLPFLENYPFRYFVGQNLGEILRESRTLEGNLTISYEGIHEDRDVVWLFRRMLSFYVEICKPPEDEAEHILSFGFITPYMFDDPRSGHWSRNYYNYWEKLEKKAIVEGNRKWQGALKKMKLGVG